ncbi:MAG: cation transporter [Oligoflexales bacterium]|nr:cation transporter [Oligoflexales bacterium]
MSSHGCHSKHSHSHTHNLSVGEKKLWLAILANTLIALLQALAGIWSGSLALLSDAAHNFSDVISLWVSVVAEKLSRRESTPSQTFGYKRAEILAALFNTVSLIFVSVMLIREAIERLLNPVPVNSGWVILFAGLAILINGGSAWLLKQGSSNLNMRSAYLHLLSDALISLAVMLGGIFIYFFEIYWLDSLMSLLVTAFLLYASWNLLMATLRVIMHFTPPHINLTAVEKLFMRFSEVQNIHHVHIWQLTDKGVHFEAHVDFRNDLKLSEISLILKEIALHLRQDFDITHVSLQPEIGVEDSKKLIVRDCPAS